MAIVSDADDTVPNRVMTHVDLLVEVRELGKGSPPAVEVIARGDRNSCELEAIKRYDAHAPGRDDRLLLDKFERDAARERWIYRLRKGQPVYLEHNWTLRLKTVVVGR